jgi:preprotein translocase subunit SecA
VSNAVTIATNMAGRGTDIQLGGNLEMRIERELKEITDPAERDARIADIKAQIAVDKQKVLAAGGLYIVGTERHESRRIDNQLRGRAGRQGDPGHSKFFLSLQDELMRIFPVESMDSMLGKLGLEQGESITHPWVTKAIERAQARVEARNFDIRKNILKYDDVMNDQRKVIFAERLELMDSEDVSETTASMRHEVVGNLVAKAIPERSYAEQWDIDLLTESARTTLNVNPPIKEWSEEEGIDADMVRERLKTAADEFATAKIARFTPEIMRQVEKSILLQSIDSLWRDHLVTLDHLSKVIGWRGLAQRDPLTEYKREAFELFEQLLSELREVVTRQLSHVEIQMRQPEPPLTLRGLSEIHIDPTSGENDAESNFTGTMPRTLGPASALSAIAAMGAAEGDVIEADPALRQLDPKLLVGVSRNAPCPCGSGKKFKHCHGAF